MNNSTADPNDNVHGFTYGIVFTIVMLFLITAILLACARLHLPLTRLVSNWGGAQPPTTALAATTHAQQQGIDDHILASYPKLLYSQMQERDSPLTSCSICLDDYNDSDVLRRLPDCGHLYHLACIDSWLNSHPTCPLCRTSPSPARPDSRPSGLRQEEVAVHVQ